MSQQALSQQLGSLAAQLFTKLFEQVIERLAVKKNTREVAPIWASIAEEFGAV